ncbi:ATP-binding cassette domain-containing protein [Prauserella endophytica]|uniref:ATP-binding cassette domain-containing protein n=1 Tax=Prauserella endophytica TaxID=1592324 RepID=UPI001E35775A|nr:ATP-binding cassette domain-containing protein [Prauserella endophytica]
MIDTLAPAPSTPATEWAVQAHGLTKTFDDHRAVDGLDLSIRTGSIYGLLGPNGSGKTTTVRMLATLLRPDAGTARIFGHNVTTHGHTVRQLIGVTGQYASVDERLSATENLVIFARLLGLSRAAARRRAAQLLEEFDLSDAAGRALSKFSGGMRRRLDLAASLIVRPPLIFLDEPTTGLDPRNRNRMWSVIRRLVEQGSTVLLTTQYLDEADQLADRIMVIDRGRVIADDTPDELKASVGRSVLLLRPDVRADLDRVRERAEALLGTRATVSPEAGRVSVPLENPDAVTDLLTDLRGNGLRLSELSVQKPTLDEVFLTLTGHAAEPATTPKSTTEEGAP